MASIEQSVGDALIVLEINFMDIVGYLPFVTVERPRASSPVEMDANLLSLAANETDTAIVITDQAGLTIYVNEGFTRMLGYTLGDMRGRLPSTVVGGPYTDPKTLAWIGMRVKNGDGFRTEVLIYDRQQRPMWISAVVNAVKDAEGNCSSLVGVWSDITSTKMHEVLQHNALRAIAHEVPLQEVMELICLEVERVAPEVVVSVRRMDWDQKIWSVSAPSLPSIYVQTFDGVLLGGELPPFDGSEESGYFVVFDEQAPASFWGRKADLARTCGLVACWWHPVRAGDGNVVGTIAFYFRDARRPGELHERLIKVARDLCSLALDRDASKERIRRLAYFDTLTGLAGRSAFIRHVTAALDDSSCEGRAATILFLDVDRFKQINDSFGHAAGDLLLREIGSRLDACRQGKDFIGRLSGDEFVVAMFDCDARAAVARCSSVMKALNEPFTIGTSRMTPTVSVGIAVFPQHGKDVETLLQHADMAMYRAKATGRHQSSMFDLELSRIAHENLRLTRALDEALATDQLELHYQPQVSLSDGCLYGVEALARWHDPESGPVSPLRFVALAEEGGIITDLDRWVLRTACRQLGDWRRNGVAVAHVSINISPSSLCDSTLPQLVAKRLAENSLDASDLVIEITEAVFLDTATESFFTLKAIHELGIKLAIDDFGTGYSSLSYLHRMPFQEIKLDKSFVQEIESNENAKALAMAVMSIGKSLGLSVVAEGVENERQEDVLRNLGFPVAQGYLYAKPMSVRSLMIWLDQRSATKKRDDT